MSDTQSDDEEQTLEIPSDKYEVFMDAFSQANAEDWIPVARHDTEAVEARPVDRQDGRAEGSRIETDQWLIRDHSGETYTVSSGDTEEWLGADVDGSLEVNGSLELIDDPDTPGDEEKPTDPVGVSTNPLDLPMGPINMRTMEAGVALFLGFILAVLLGAAAFLRNSAAIIVWGLAIIALLASGLFGIGLETFWILVIATTLTIMAGGVVRWMQ